MAGREVREYTNLSDAKDKKWGSKGGKDKTDDEDLAFKRMVAKMQEVAGERGGYLHGRGGAEVITPESGCGSKSFGLTMPNILFRLLSDRKVEMEAEEDAERLRRRTEKRAFAAFKKAASLADASPLPVLQPIRVDPKPRTGIRQQVLVRSIVEVKPKRHRISGPTDGTNSLDIRSSMSDPSAEMRVEGFESAVTEDSHEKLSRDGSGILGLAYETSDDEVSDPEPKDLEKDVSAKSATMSRYGYGTALTTADSP